MRLTKIDITNAVGCRRFDAALTAPITLIAGPNGAGKTSIIQAVRFALTGEMPRVALKKDAGHLVTEGSKAGRISVEWDGGLATIALPDAKPVDGDNGDIYPSPAMPFLCDMHRFSTLDNNARRSFMFGLTGTAYSADEVARRLADRQADPNKVSAIIPLLRSGFPAASEEAKSRAREAKASWRTITGETYGAKKAEGWAAPVGSVTTPTALAGLRAALDETDRAIEAATTGHGAMQARAKMAAEQRQQLADLRERAGRYARISEKLNLDTAERDTWKKRVEAMRGCVVSVDAMPCPKCGNMLVMRGDELVHAESPAIGTEEDLAKLPEYEQALATMERSVQAGQRDLDAADSAARALAEIQDAGMDAPPDDEEMERSQAEIAEMKKKRKEIAESIRSMEEAEREKSEAAKNTAKASGYHADVQAWDLIADALAPDGIPGELLSQALKPINDIMAQAAADTGWMQVTIDAEMAIRSAGRPYALLSESEQWRADAMLTAAIAQLSGVRLMLLDRMDVLDLPSRGDLLGWLEVMAANTEILSCIVAGTLKSLPTGLTESFEAFWVDGGYVNESVAQAA